jgi:hypothetical protein
MRGSSCDAKEEFSCQDKPICFFAERTLHLQRFDEKKAMLEPKNDIIDPR